jgi:hypothetical protein
MREGHIGGSDSIPIIIWCDLHHTTLPHSHPQVCHSKINSNHRPLIILTHILTETSRHEKLLENQGDGNNI